MEICIELENPEQGEADQIKRRSEEWLCYEEVANETICELEKAFEIIDLMMEAFNLGSVEKNIILDRNVLCVCICIVLDYVVSAREKLEERLKE